MGKTASKSTTHPIQSAERRIRHRPAISTPPMAVLNAREREAFRVSTPALPGCCLRTEQEESRPPPATLSLRNEGGAVPPRWPRRRRRTRIRSIGGVSLAATHTTAVRRRAVAWGRSIGGDGELRSRRRAGRLPTRPRCLKQREGRSRTRGWSRTVGGARATCSPLSNGLTSRGSELRACSRADASARLSKAISGAVSTHIQDRFRGSPTPPRLSGSFIPARSRRRGAASSTCDRHGTGSSRNACWRDRVVRSERWLILGAVGAPRRRHGRIHFERTPEPVK